MEAYVICSVCLNFAISDECSSFKSYMKQACKIANFKIQCSDLNLSKSIILHSSMFHYEYQAMGLICTKILQWTMLCTSRYSVGKLKRLDGEINYFDETISIKWKKIYMMMIYLSDEYYSHDELFTVWWKMIKVMKMYCCHESSLLWRKFNTVVKIWNISL